MYDSFTWIGQCCEIRAVTSGMRERWFRKVEALCLHFRVSSQNTRSLLTYWYKVWIDFTGCMNCWWRKLIVVDYWAHGCCIVGLFCIEVMHVRIWMFGYHSIELTAKITVNWLKLRIKILHHIDCSTKFCIAFK